MKQALTIVLSVGCCTCTDAVETEFGVGSVFEFGIETINAKATFLSCIKISLHKFFCRNKYRHSCFFALQPQYTQSSKHMFVDMSFNNISLQAKPDLHMQNLAQNWPPSPTC